MAGTTHRFPPPLRGALLLLAALALAAAALLPAAPAAADDAKAREIMQRVNDRDDGDNQTADMQMTLISRHGERRERTIKSFRKDRGKDTLTLSFFLSPADVKNTAFLTYDYDEPGKDDDQWLYLPELRKTKRIASSDKSGSFMGSDFNYSDMTRPDLTQYDFTLMQEVEVEGHKTWQIQAVPRTEQVKADIGYEKSVLWVRQDNLLVIRAIRWVHNSVRRKYMQVKSAERVDGIWIATEMQMVTREGNATVHATVLKWSNIRFNQNLSPDMFTVRRLEQGY